MNAVDIANQYFAAWNQHDSQALLGLFAQGGTYCDPITKGEIAGARLATYAQALWGAFPDLSFEITRMLEARRVVAAEWVMTGTNDGPYRGFPPTRKAISLPGADFIAVEGDKIRSVTGYFDTRDVPEQLGLQVVVQPDAIGSFRFGTSTSVQTGKRIKPGAFGITQIMNDTEQEAQAIREMVRATGKELMTMQGFIGLVTARIGERGVTISAWEQLDQVKQIMRSPAHSAAMKDFFAGGNGASVYTSVWTPARINAMWMRCGACGKVSEFEKNAGVCTCGERLPEPPPYW